MIPSHVVIVTKCHARTDDLGLLADRIVNWAGEPGPQRRCPFVKETDPEYPAQHLVQLLAITRRPAVSNTIIHFRTRPLIPVVDRSTGRELIPALRCCLE